MKAIVYERYGSPDVLELREVERPEVGEDDVLIRVRASSVNVADWFFLTGRPSLLRLTAGLSRPKQKILGRDVAGTVEAVGGSVTRFRPGDEVFGEIDLGAYAEYALAPEEHLASKPADLTFEQAAALPLAGVTALHGLRDAGELQPGQTVLVNGASGGVGTFAVQIAKALGAEVTGVCSARNVELVRSLGADRVIDYTRDDFTRDGRRYDVILDNVENRSLSDCRRALEPDGTLVLNSGTGARGIGLIWRLVKPSLLSTFVRQKLRRFLSLPNHEDLGFLKDLVEAGELRPVIERTFPLAEVPEALRRQGEGHARGKSVITV